MRYNGLEEKEKSKTMKKVISVFIISIFITFGICVPAQAIKTTVPPNATKVVKYHKHYYALYKGKVCSLTKVNKKVKTLTIPKYIKANGQKYKVMTVHYLGLDENKGKIKKVILNADNMETIEEPMFYKHWRKDHHKKLIIKIKDKETRKWLNKF